MDTSEVTEARFLFVINFSYLSLWRIALLSAAIFKYIYRTNISPENRNEEKQKSKPFFRWHNAVGKEKKKQKILMELIVVALYWSSEAKFTLTSSSCGRENSLKALMKTCFYSLYSSYK